MRKKRTLLQIQSWLVLLPLLAGAVLGCSGVPRAHSAVPNGGADPTPLGKCKVAASQERPLVTEWPASEKSHLEALIGRGAVAVAYSGCELRVLDACPVKGHYDFQRTSLNTDTYEIASADDLYAKLPLGAVRLEGDLERSGRLAVKTTVAGQFLLSDNGRGEVPTDGTCSQATHIVTGLSVGAFKLLAGGKAKVSAGGGVSSIVTIGGSRSEEEVTLTEAGDPKACEETSDTPNAQCKSPLQIFLQKLPGRAEVQPGVRTAMDEERAPPGAVRVNFALPSADAKWSLLNYGGTLVCDLPCSRWIGSNSGYKLQLDADRPEDIQVIPVPDSLGYSAGRVVDAVPLKERGSLLTGTLLVSVGAFVGGVGTFFFILGSTGTDKTHQALTDIGPVMMGVGGAPLLVGIPLTIYSRSAPMLDMTLSVNPSSASVRVLPGAVEVSSGGVNPAHVWLTPAGAVGSF